MQVDTPSTFWDLLAPHLWRIENSYFDLGSLRRILSDVRQRVLVVGAGQGLIVGDLIKRGMQCDGVDLSQVMVEFAKTRRGLSLVRADARAMPFDSGSYRTVICATGVVDFMAEEEQIAAILNEARRVLSPDGKLFVAFYRVSVATEKFLNTLGLLRDGVLLQRETLEIYRMRPSRLVAWVAKQARVGIAQAALLTIRSWAFSTLQEKRNAIHLQKVLGQAKDSEGLIKAAQATIPYRNADAIRALLQRLRMPVGQIQEFASSYVATVGATRI